MISWFNAANGSVSIGNSSTLTVSMEGLYYCRFVHGTTLIRSCPARVSFAKFEVPSNINSEGDKTMRVHRTNDFILSSCEHIYSVPPPTIKWTFNDKNLPNGSHILPSGNLLIADFNFQRHIGEYRCVASNSITDENWQSPTTTLKKKIPSKYYNSVVTTEHVCV